MAVSVTESKDASLGEEPTLACAKCAGKTAHAVLASIDVDGEETEPNWQYNWFQRYQIIKCLGCKTISFRDTSGNSEDYTQDDDGDFVTTVYEKLFPSRLEGLKGLDADVRHLPPTVRRIYEETRQALLNNSPVLAGIGLRAPLEATCVSRNAEGRDLFAKIDDLARKGELTRGNAQILHKIRSLGNKAAHEMEPHSERQLSLALQIIENLLRDTFIIPELVKTDF